MIDVAPAFAGLVATTIVDGAWWLDGEPVGESWVDLERALRMRRRRRRRRRRRIRAASRARKARRGWR